MGDALSQAHVEAFIIGAAGIVVLFGNSTTRELGIRKEQLRKSDRAAVERGAVGQQAGEWIRDGRAEGIDHVLISLRARGEVLLRGCRSDS